MDNSPNPSPVQQTSTIQSSTNISNETVSNDSIARTKRKRQIKVARRLIREVLLENQANVTDEEVETMLRDIASTFGQEEMELSRWELLQVIRNCESARNDVDYEHEFDGAFFAVGNQEAWLEEDAQAEADLGGIQPRIPRVPTTRTERTDVPKRRPKIRNPKHSSPYHLVPEPSPLDPDADLTTDASADPTSPCSYEPHHFCRFCLAEDFEHNLLTPCRCSGSTKYVHAHCLLRWRKTSSQPLAKVQCEICKTFYRFKGHPFSFGWVALHERVNLKNATRLCWVLMFLYHFLLQYVIRALLNLLPSGFLDGTTGMDRSGSCKHMWMFFPLIAIAYALQIIHYHLRHVPLTLFFLGAFKNLPDEVMTGYSVVHLLCGGLAYIFAPFQIFSDVLWLAVLWYGLPTLYIETKTKVASVAQGLMRLWMEVGTTSLSDEVLNY
jgi:hypothetical protein